jgi:hypothetical protein
MERFIKENGLSVVTCLMVLLAVVTHEDVFSVVGIVCAILSIAQVASRWE